MSKGKNSIFIPLSYFSNKCIGHLNRVFAIVEKYLDLFETDKMFMKFQSLLYTYIYIIYVISKIVTNRVSLR